MGTGGGDGSRCEKGVKGWWELNWMLSKEFYWKVTYFSEFQGNQKKDYFMHTILLIRSEIT